MPRIATRLALLSLLVPFTLTAQHAAKVDTAQLQRILVAEDSRGNGSEGVKPLMSALTSDDSMLRRIAVRGIGRLQRPDLARDVAARLTDQSPGVRAEAANAIAQSVNRTRRNASDSTQVDVKWAAGVLGRALADEKDQHVVDALAESLGRLPFGDSTTAQAAQSAILARGGTGFGIVHSLYWMGLFRARNGGLSQQAVALLKTAAKPPVDPATRRVAVLALTAGNALDSATVTAASNDPDEQVRRLALAGVRTLSTGDRARIVRSALADKSVIVRVGAVGAARVGSSTPDCNPIIGATNDLNAYVRLTAIDTLAKPCADTPATAAALVRIVDQETVPLAKRDWRAQGHALVSLARVDKNLARGPIAVMDASPRPILRAYAAQAAAVVGDTVVMLRLSRDADNNVREAAIAGLALVSKHNADSVYIAGLQSKGYQVVLASATALNGSKDASALPALLDAFDRVSAERRENARDPRVAMLARIGEMGSSSNVTRLQPYLADFDTTIAVSTAKILSKWTNTAVSAQPVPLKIQPEPLAKIALAKSISLRVTMTKESGGGTFVIRLFANETPATVARMVRLADAHFYDGHLFQRVEPNFVVQGGGPDASEYVGDAAFMRDELAWHSNYRGTLGVSGRGRDTGDGQWFFNLTDNTRLDHEYTVFGEVASGMAVVERILEGDQIATVRVIR